MPTGGSARSRNAPAGNPAPQSEASVITPSTPLMDYNSTDVRLAISSNCESFTDAGRAAEGQSPFVWPPVFSIDGRFILQSTPSRFNSTFFSEVPSMSALQQAAACAWAQSQIIAQAQRSSTSVDRDTLSIWAQMAPGFPNNPNHGGGAASTGSHGGGVQIGQNLPPPPPHPMYAGFANAWRHPAPITPQERKSFAFGRSGASPINLAPNFLSPSMLSGAASQQLSGGAASNLSPVGAASQPAGAASQPLGFGAASHLAATFQSPVGAASQPAGAASQPLGFGAASHFPHLSALLANQTNQPPLLATQTNHQPPVSAVPSQFNSIAQTGLQALPLHPAQFGLQPKALRPWDIEALSRPAQEQDPNMMRGFTRTNIATLIAAAKAKRIAQGPDATRNTIVEKVVWPEMKSFTEEDFMRTRKLFHAATNASFTSCIFKEFKDCMLISCAQACRRKFHLDTDALWLSCDDAKLQRWLAELFGPKSKEDAIRRLEAVKLAPHSDAQDSQSTFVSKLNSCATDFNFVINDIADTHQSWSNDSSLLSTGELTFKEVMDIWRKKFSKQDRSVFSVQIKECRDFMDRSKELEFNDIVLMLTNHFTSIDDSVSSGKTAYTSMPSKTRREDFPLRKRLLCQALAVVQLVPLHCQALVNGTHPLAILLGLVQSRLPKENILARLSLVTCAVSPAETRTIISVSGALQPPAQSGVPATTRTRTVMFGKTPSQSRQSLCRNPSRRYSQEQTKHSSQVG